MICHTCYTCAKITPLLYQAADLVLHWGVRIGKKEWVMPPRSVRPPGSKEAGKIALETAFQQSSEKLELSGSQLTVQSLELSIPADAEVTGLTFVMRSQDESAWFRDGGICLFDEQKDLGIPFNCFSN